jgi:hypothetical protein
MENKALDKSLRRRRLTRILPALLNLRLVHDFCAQSLSRNTGLMLEYLLSPLLAPVCIGSHVSATCRNENI